MVLEKLESNMQRKELDYYFTSYKQINTKWIKNLNVKTKNLKTPRRKYW